MSAILLLPGMTLNATAFPAFSFPTVAVDFNQLVLSPDGASDDLRRRRMGVYVDLLDQRLGQAAEWNDTRRIVVAHSFGAMLTLSWWLAHAGRGVAAVDGMVLISTTAGPMFDAVKLLFPGPGGREMRVPLKRGIRWWNLAVVTRAAKRFLGGPGSDEVDRVNFQALADRTDWAVDLAGWRNTDWRAMRSYRFAMENFDLRDRLREITPPTIVLHGSRDSLFPVTVARDLAAGLPRAELRVVEGAGHALPLTHGREVTRAVEHLIPNP